ncbi:VVA0879 family protein [Frankia sp. AvcI1]|uniref:VVA0879 family protein n=1 Tax=Frankia sp. AvcI1 TaxID=573496 RepID=UPI000B334AD6|nr:VVA0879 family protein [Frankia sp. AvcI1]
MQKLTGKVWRNTGRALFGRDPMDWRYICAGCGRVSTGRMWQKFGRRDGAARAAAECIGNALPPSEQVRLFQAGGCLWKAAGPVLLSGCVEIIDEPRRAVFPFAEPGMRTSPPPVSLLLHSRTS